MKTDPLKKREIPCRNGTLTAINLIKFAWSEHFEGGSVKMRKQKGNHKSNAKKANGINFD